VKEESGIIQELVMIMNAAIKSDDWHVDGACDPDAVLHRAEKWIADRGISTEEEQWHD